MPFPRLTWAGLLVATLGWGLLLSYPLLSSHGAPVADGHEIRDPARFILIFGENALITGLAIALLGALETAINLLGRNSAAASAPKASSASAASRHPSLTAAPQLLTPRQTNEVVTKGALAGRDYVLFRDGSVVVETLLGPRRFLSLNEAQQFIGAS